MICQVNIVYRQSFNLDKQILCLYIFFMETLEKVREPRPLVPIPDMLERTVTRNPNSIAIQRLTENGWEKWSYKELFALVKTKAEELKEERLP